MRARFRWIARGYALVCLCWLAVFAAAAAGAVELGVGSVVLAGIAAVIAGALVLVGSRVPDDAAPERGLGGYKLVEQLGTGGMGEVWRAEHDALIRPAAVKLMRRELIGSISRQELEAMTARFKREVQVTATLSSPHTVEVFDFGEAPDGSLYYVMELLHGFDAESLVRKHGPQPAERVVHFMLHACASLAEAHHRNLIHRDIKPANIYVCAIGMEVDFIKILDFGLVRDLNTEHRLTMQGSTPGTPAYLAPEFVTDRVDHRADLYALGCVAYWLLTGQLVFDADTKIAMLAAHTSQPPLPPSQRTELPIPRELDDLVLALLAKEPSERPQTAAELARRLAAVPLAASWTQARAEAWWQAHVPSILARGRNGIEPAISRAGL